MRIHYTNMSPSGTAVPCSAQFERRFPNRSHRSRASCRVGEAIPIAPIHAFRARHDTTPATPVAQAPPGQRTTPFLTVSLNLPSDRSRSTSIHADESIKTAPASLTVSPSPRPHPLLQSLRWCPSPKLRTSPLGIRLHGGDYIRRRRPESLPVFLRAAQAQ